MAGFVYGRALQTGGSSVEPMLQPGSRWSLADALRADAVLGMPRVHEKVKEGEGQGPGMS